MPGHRKIEGDIRRVNALEADHHMDSLVDPAQCHVPAQFPAIRRTGDKGCIIFANSDSPDHRFRVAPIRYLRGAQGKQHNPPGEQPPSSSQFGSCNGVEASAGATVGHGTAKPAARAAARHCRTVNDPVGSKNTPLTMSVPGGAARAKPPPAA